MKKIRPYILTATALLIGAGIYIDKHPGRELEKPDPPDKADLKNYGPAPDFAGISKWLNSEPLTMPGLRGKVVLVDFWTYSCINCIRTLPYVTHWYDRYKDQGLVVVGVHTPEFAFEKNTENVARAIKQFHIHYPVAQDNDYATWNNYGNRYWPAEYLIDKNGNVVYPHFGEGHYDQTENAIRALLGLDEKKMTGSGEDLSGVQSPEMYFGTARLQNLAPEQRATAAAKNYVFPKNLDLNSFALEGTWQFTEQSARLTAGEGKMRLKFHAGKVHIVAASPLEGKLQIIVDGQSRADIVVKDSALYTLFDSEDYADHVIEIIINNPGFEAFTFTFG